MQATFKKSSLKIHQSTHLGPCWNGPICDSVTLVINDNQCALPLFKFKIFKHHSADYFTDNALLRRHEASGLWLGILLWIHLTIHCPLQFLFVIFVYHWEQPYKVQQIKKTFVTNIGLIVYEQSVWAAVDKLPSYFCNRNLTILKIWQF